LLIPIPTHPLPMLQSRSGARPSWYPFPCLDPRDSVPGLGSFVIASGSESVVLGLRIMRFRSLYSFASPLSLWYSLDLRVLLGSQAISCGPRLRALPSRVVVSGIGCPVFPPPIPCVGTVRRSLGVPLSVSVVNSSVCLRPGSAGEPWAPGGLLFRPGTCGSRSRVRDRRVRFHGSLVCCPFPWDCLWEFSVG
jgi:hypothetical protein